ncbi:MAG: NAD(P)-dependent oxidoreductase [Planctomycetota bacterium]|jgi:2-hydroxy-3-oxopropionate reductase
MGSLEALAIGYVGLGNMGLPGARHLHQAKANIKVWNRSKGPVAQAKSLGLTPADSLQELAQHASGGVLCLNLSNTQAVQEVVFGPEGLAQYASPETLYIDFGTSSVLSTREFAKKQRWLDAPVSGGQVGAESASLSIMAGGSSENFQRALPVLQTVGKRVTHVGPSGAGQVTKLANQLIVAQTIDAVAQAIRLAELAGVDPAIVREALFGGFAESRILQLHGDRMIRRDFQPGGRSELQLKDVRLICELASAVGLESKTLDHCHSQWEKFVGELGHGDLDHSGLFKLYE